MPKYKAVSRYVDALSPEQEDRVLTSKMKGGATNVEHEGNVCVVMAGECVGRLTHVSDARWSKHHLGDVADAFDFLTRFSWEARGPGRPRRDGIIADAIRNRILRNRARRALSRETQLSEGVRQ